MIDKFISIKNIGRFRDCSLRGDVAFRKLTLLFAENGKGKTTLCSILRSLQIGKHEVISERKTLGSTGQTYVQMRIDGNTVIFSNNSWSNKHPNIAIFDSGFIHNNVYAGDFVDHEHKKNLYRVIVGAQGVQLAQRVDLLNEQIRTANTDIQTRKGNLLALAPQGASLAPYLSLLPIQDVDTKIQQKSTEIATRQRALEKAEEIRSKSLLSKIQLPSLPDDFTIILKKQLADLAADAETRVKQQIEKHQMKSGGESWLSHGLEYIKEELCPLDRKSVV